MSSGMFFLKRNDFQETVGISFRELRDDKDFSDVTLACEDLELETHKVILSSCSPFFRRLLKRSKHQHPLLYMRGLKADQLKVVVDFIYFGEVSIVQEKLEAFLELAEELELQGLMGADANKTENTKTQQTILEPKTEFKPKTSPKPNKAQSDQLQSTNSIVQPSKFDFEYEQAPDKSLVPEFKTKTTKVHIDEETFRKRDTLFGKRDHGFWTCNVCSFTSPNRGVLREHVEKHIEGLEFPCDHCGKIMRSSMSLRKHYGSRCRMTSNNIFHFHFTSSLHHFTILPFCRTSVALRKHFSRQHPEYRKS